MKKFGKRLVGIYEKAFPAHLSWEARLEAAAKTGYDFLEISVDDSQERLARLTWTPAERIALRHAMENTGVPILSMGVSAHRSFPLGSASAELRERGFEILHQAIELASDLGIRVIQTMGYDVFYEPSDDETKARFLEGLAQGARWASAAGVMLALENVDVDTVNSVEKALYYVRAVNSPWLNVYADMGNLVAAGYDPIEQLRLGRGYLAGVHVKDALPGEVRGVAFGTGIVPFENVFQTLAEIDYWGMLVVEMWSHLDTSGGDPAAAAVNARALVTRLEALQATNRALVK